jgi:hypothetical protein
MEGNSYALKNIRSLISMGVSYNEDGMTYLQKVCNEASRFDDNPDVYANEDYNELAAIIAPTIVTFGNMFKEFQVHEKDLNYEDEENTEEEYKYAEYKVLADMMREVQYLDGISLYDFCIGYAFDSDDYSSLYPLVAALNDGQAAMTRVAHFYNVVRYSMVIDGCEEIDAEIDALEKEYIDHPFNIYTGVDRTIYQDSFALTSEAYRADAFTESGLSAALFDAEGTGLNVAAKVVGYIGAAYIAFGLGQRGYAAWTAKKAMDAYQTQFNSTLNQFSNQNLYNVFNYNGDLAKDAINDLFKKCVSAQENFTQESVISWSLQDKFAYLEKHFNSDLIKNDDLLSSFGQIKNQLAKFQAKDEIFKSAQETAERATQKVAESSNILKGCFVIGGILMLISAFKLGYSAWHYYHPKYDDIPTAMVDLIETADGDRYIKYDVVYEVEERDEGDFIAADLNAFEANRWNALYYTKSYEAGKPLIANEFRVSSNSNVPDKGYMPVHRFGEILCYDLNKYNFTDDHSIYLSIKQSTNSKAAVEEVPMVVGTILNEGFFVIAGGIGIVAGIGGTLASQEIIKKRKFSKENDYELNNEKFIGE